MTVKKALVFCLYLTIFSFFLFLMHRINFFISPQVDTSFHISRIYEIRQSFLQNRVPGWLNFQTFNNIGQAIQGMYPDLTLWPLVYGTLWLSPVTQYNVIIFFIFLLKYFIAYYVIKHFTDKYSAIALSAINLIGGSGISIFANGSLGQLLSTAFLPLVIYAFIYFVNDQSEYTSPLSKTKSVILLAVSLALIFWSHTITTVLLILLLFFWYVISLLKHKTNFIRSAILLSISGLLFLILNLPILFRIFLIGHSHILTVAQPNLSDAATGIWQIIATSFNFSNSPGNTIPAAAIILVGMTIVARCIKKENNSIYSSFIIISISLLIISSSIFPWSLLQNTPFNIIQLPTNRIIPIITVFLTFVYATSSIKKTNFLYILAILTVFNAIGVVHQYDLKKQHQEPLTSVHLISIRNSDILKSKVITNESFNITGNNKGNTALKRIYFDYAPMKVGTDQLNPWVESKAYYNINAHYGKNNANKIWFSYKSSNSDSVTYTATNLKKGNLILPVLNYSSLKYTVKINDGKYVPYRQSSTGTFEILLKSDYKKITITVTNHTPRAYLILLGTSCIVLLFCVGTLLLPIRHDNKILHEIEK